MYAVVATRCQVLAVVVMNTVYVVVVNSITRVCDMQHGRHESIPHLTKRCIRVLRTRTKCRLMLSRLVSSRLVIAPPVPIGDAMWYVMLYLVFSWSHTLLCARSGVMPCGTCVCVRVRVCMCVCVCLILARVVVPWRSDIMQCGLISHFGVVSHHIG